MNNVASLRIVEESRRAVLGRPAAAGLNGAGLLTSLDDSLQHVVRRQLLEYNAELWFAAAPLTVRHRVAGVGTTSFVLSSGVYAPMSGTAAVRAEATIVLIDAEARTARPLPDDLRAILSCRCWQPDTGEDSAPLGMSNRC